MPVFNIYFWPASGCCIDHVILFSFISFNTWLTILVMFCCIDYVWSKHWSLNMRYRRVFGSETFGISNVGIIVEQLFLQWDCQLSTQVKYVASLVHAHRNLYCFFFEQFFFFLNNRNLYC
jgi:hypothetical protein